MRTYWVPSIPQSEQVPGTGGWDYNLCLSCRPSVFQLMLFTLSLKYSLEQWGLHWLQLKGSGSTVTLVTSASHSKRPIYPTLLLCTKKASSALSGSTHSTCCLHLLLSETLNMVFSHSGTQRQWARESSAFPVLAREGTATIPATLTPVIQDKVAAVVLLLVPSTAGRSGRKEKSTCWGPLYLSHPRQPTVSFWMLTIILDVVCYKLAPA